MAESCYLSLYYLLILLLLILLLILLLLLLLLLPFMIFSPPLPPPHPLSIIPRLRRSSLPRVRLQESRTSLRVYYFRKKTIQIRDSPVKESQRKRKGRKNNGDNNDNNDDNEDTVGKLTSSIHHRYRVSELSDDFYPPKNRYGQANNNHNNNNNHQIEILTIEH